ncbi:UDP-N-acetylglucosamine 1-carboxyvinyltransferase [compost metagenome]
MFGGNRLRPATVEAPYIIRVVLALFIAAIQIEGVSIIRHADPIRRAHPRFVENLTRMGADVQWI